VGCGLYDLASPASYNTWPAVTSAERINRRHHLIEAYIMAQHLDRYAERFAKAKKFGGFCLNRYVHKFAKPADELTQSVCKCLSVKKYDK